MSKFAIPIALGALALVAACAHRATPAPPPVVVVPQQAPAVVAVPPVPTVVVAQPITLRAGVGRIESISTVAASPGASPTASSSMRRLGIKMSDGTVQYVDSEVPNVAVGDRVELTADGYIRPI
jgi:hypothetical protein